MNALDLGVNQYLEIDGEKFKVINMTKYVEKSSNWIEYMLIRVSDNKKFYLNVERVLKTILYEVMEEKNIDIMLNMEYDGEQYNLIEKGQGKVVSYEGSTDVAIGDVDEYFEYECTTNPNKILSIEKWAHMTEISVGHVIKRSEILVLIEYDE